MTAESNESNSFNRLRNEAPDAEKNIVRTNGEDFREPMPAYAFTSLCFDPRYNPYSDEYMYKKG